MRLRIDIFHHHETDPNLLEIRSAIYVLIAKVEKLEREKDIEKELPAIGKKIDAITKQVGKIIT